MRSLHLRLVRASLKAGREPLKFAIDSTLPSVRHLTDLLQSCGLSMVEQRTLGEEINGKRILGGFVVAVVK